MVTLSFSRRCVVDARATSVRATVTTCGQIGIVLENDGRGHHLRDARNRSLSLGVLFPEDFVGLGIVDDRRGCPQIGNQIAAGVDLVARDDRVGHLRGRRRCTALRGRGPAARRRFRGRFRRGLLDRRFRAGLSGCSRDARQTDEASERKVTDPENWFPAHESRPEAVTCPGSRVIVARQLIDRKAIIVFNTQITYGCARELSPYQLCATNKRRTFRALRADIRRIGYLKSTR